MKCRPYWGCRPFSSFAPFLESDFFSPVFSASFFWPSCGLRGFLPAGDRTRRRRRAGAAVRTPTGAIARHVAGAGASGAGAVVAGAGISAAVAGAVLISRLRIAALVARSALVAAVAAGLAAVAAISAAGLLPADALDREQRARVVLVIERPIGTHGDRIHAELLILGRGGVDEARALVTQTVAVHAAGIAVCGEVHVRAPALDGHNRRALDLSRCRLRTGLSQEGLAVHGRHRGIHRKGLGIDHRKQAVIRLHVLAHLDELIGLAAHDQLAVHQCRGARGGLGELDATCLLELAVLAERGGA